MLVETFNNFRKIVNLDDPKINVEINHIIQMVKIKI